MKIKRSVKNISRYKIGGFKHITKRLFFYNHSSELKRKYNNIVSWILLVDDSEDIVLTHILEISFYRKEARSVGEWSVMWTEKTQPKNKREKTQLWKYGKRNHASLLEILDGRILDSLNIRRGTNWRVKSVIGWTYGISKFCSSILSRRIKTVKTKKGC